jgi:enediyne biosynthesis protein E4
MKLDRKANNAKFRIATLPTVLLILLTTLCHASATAQQPTPTPMQTGRSYEISNLPKTPPVPGPQAKSPVLFTDISLPSKVDFRHIGSPTSKKYLLETMGGGVAIFDFNNDGRMDLFFTNGGLLREEMSAEAVPEKSDSRFWNRLYEQQVDGSFKNVTERAGLSGAGYSMGVATGDFDNDGFVDLYVTGYAGNHLYQNNGNGTFTDVTKKLGVAGGGWSTSAGWFDFDRDGRLDLFVARYLTWDFAKGQLFCGDPRPGSRAYCHPDNFKGTTNLLYHQKPAGGFEDVTVKAGISDSGGKALGVAFADFDNDGWLDVFVANDSVRQSLYRNKTDGTFEDIAVLSGVGYNENGKSFAGMGVDAADYDNDGWADVVITTLSNETYPLFHNNKDLSFGWATESTSVGQISLLYSGWGTRFIDADNDGWRDIFVAQSHVLDTIERSTSYLKYKQPPLLMRNTGQSFVNISSTAGAPFNIPITARGAAFGDLNNDGQVDIVINILNDSALILRNEGTKNNWIGLYLVGSKSNREGIGSRVVVTDGNGRKQIFDVSTSGSYLSANDPRIIVGIGAASSIKTIEVRWPSGGVQTITNPPLRRYLTIDEANVEK